MAASDSIPKGINAVKRRALPDVVPHSVGASSSLEFFMQKVLALRAAVLAAVLSASTGAFAAATAIDTSAATDGIAAASTAVLAVLAAMIAMMAGIWGVRKVLRMFGR